VGAVADGIAGFARGVGKIFKKLFKWLI
jgi:hypothetical protein